MNNKSEIHFALKSAVETLATHPGPDPDRLRSAVASLKALKPSNFEHSIDRTCFAIVQRSIERFDLGDIANIDVENVRRQIWALYERNAPTQFAQT